MPPTVAQRLCQTKLQDVPTGLSSSFHGDPCRSGASAKLEGCQKETLLSAKLEGMKAHVSLQLQPTVDAA